MADFSTSASGLLRLATTLHDRGEIHEAIEALRGAYAAIAADSKNHTVTTFLRLPAYLQEAGQREEAWSALFELLANGYPTQPSTPELIAMDRSAIYRAIQLFLEREGHFLHAVLYGVLAIYYWAAGLRSQKRVAEFGAFVSPRRLSEEIGKLLRKANRLDLVPVLVPVVKTELDRIAPMDDAVVATEIKAILRIQ
jgi:hypothetical protein